MADVAAPPTAHELSEHITPAAETAVQHPPVTPGKVAMWLFLATEIMFFTGLIGSYIVLRSGSPPTSYSNLYTPATDLTRLQGTWGVVLEHVDEAKLDQAVAVVRKVTGMRQHEAEVALSGHPGAVGGLRSQAEAERLLHQLEAAGAHGVVEPLKQYNWPLPYDALINPLSIDLTAVNTFILICSSVTMVLALSAVQRGDQAKLKIYLVATVLIGATFLGVQVYEYYQLMVGHHYPPGISASGHFRPSSSLFASCFFTMTGFHGAHVAGGVVLLTCITIGAFLGRFSRERHSPVELAGLYWHFVDLVWIILFTVVYLI